MRLLLGVAILYVVSVVGQAAFLPHNADCAWTRARQSHSVDPIIHTKYSSFCQSRHGAAASDEESEPSYDALELSSPQNNDDDEEEPPDDLGNIQIPSTGVSVSDEMEKAQAEKFVSEVVPIKGLPGVAQIVTTASGGGIEPVRYLVSLSPPKRLEGANEYDNDNSDDEDEEEPDQTSLVAMVDIPPFSEKLLTQIKQFLGSTSSRLATILITSRDAIHYDVAPAVFTTRKSDLAKWVNAFAEVQVVGYRLDVPRDCSDLVTQRLDGYGPWALDESQSNVTFVETGRPLTYLEWDEEVAQGVMDEGAKPPDDDALDDEDLYTQEAIRGREEGKRILAFYTPGHSFGSVTYIFPEVQCCCSGFTIPVEDDRYDETIGIGGGGPALDFRGYITTSKAGMSRMMESARHIADAYSDRFTTVLPSRGDPFFCPGDNKDRKSALRDIIDQYDKIGKIYEELGIIDKDSD